MISDGVVAALQAADPDLTGVEIAEVLWLAKVIGRTPVTGNSEIDVGALRRPPPDQEMPVLSRTESRPTPATLTSGAKSTETSGVEATAGLYVSATSGSKPKGLRTRAPAVPALSRTLDLNRSLRPLRRRINATSERELDEEATAQASAVAGRLVPYFRASKARWLDLALVIDGSPSMVVWQRTAKEFKVLLERVGAFRSVRTYSIDSGPDGTDPPSVRSGLTRPTPMHGAARNPRELLAPSGRRILLLVSDCVGPAWRTGEMLDWLSTWGRAMPTAVFQPLPLRLWDRCALDVTRVRLSTPRPGAPNSDLRVGVRDPGRKPSGPAVPILEIESRWVAPWARMLTRTATGPVWATAIFPEWSQSTRPLPEPTTGGDQDNDPVRVVLRFRATASPETFELARYLSAAPLNLPVMRLVQAVMMPQSRPRHLAELFLSDLFRRRSDYVAHQDAEAVVYDFRPGTRQVLAASLGPNTALHILARVSRFIGQHLGAALDFPAILAGGELPATMDEASRPFAEVACGVLETLGGQYRELAKRLAAALDSQPRQTDHVTTRTGGRRPLRPKPTPITRAGGPVTTPALPQGADQSQPAQPAVWGGVPPRNPNFTGRTELLAELQEQLTKVTVLLPRALHGLGGVGKTQLAVEYAYRYASEYDLVWWIPSEQAALIRQSLMLLAPRLGIAAGVGDDFGQTLTAINDVLRVGEQYPRWLLVFDNAVSASDLTPFLSNSGGHILVTSRDRAWTSVAQMIEVDVFERAESIELLKRRLPDISTEDANKLADRLGDLPLALEQAAAWQAATAMAPDRYLSLLDQQVGALMSEEKPPDYPRPVAEAWGVAFQQLTERAPGALQMLELCAFLGSEPISVRLLRSGRIVADKLPQPLGSVVADEISLHRAIRDIDKYGLAKIDPARHSIQVHRLVQAVLRDRLNPTERETYVGGVHALLAAFNPGDPDDEQNWSRHAELSPHIVPAELVDGTSNDVRRVVLDQVRYRWIQGDYEGSRELANRAVERWREMLGTDDQYTLDAGRLLAIALRSLGDIVNSRAVTEELFERATSTLGPAHEHTISIGNSRGADLRLLGRWQEALDLDGSLLELHKLVYGPDDRNTFRAANNLAVDHRLLGRFQLAQQVDEDNARRLRTVLGSDHPDHLRTVSNLSRDYYGLGEYDRALELQRQYLPTHRRVLGEDHAEVLKASRIHVATLRKTGFAVEAHEMAQRLVFHSRRRLGENHPDTICSKMTLSNCLAAVGDVAQARIIGEDAEAGFRDLLGANHPFTLAATTNVATVLRLLVEHPTARTLDERAVAGFRRTLGHEHLYTYCAEMNLANDLAVAGEYPASMSLTRHALDGLLGILHELHPQVLGCRHNLSMDLEESGQLVEARNLRHILQAQFRDVFGPSHPETQLMERRRRASIEIEPPNW